MVKLAPSTSPLIVQLIMAMCYRRLTRVITGGLEKTRQRIVGLQLMFYNAGFLVAFPHQRQGQTKSFFIFPKAGFDCKSRLANRTYAKSEGFSHPILSSLLSSNEKKNGYCNIYQRVNSFLCSVLAQDATKPQTSKAMLITDFNCCATRQEINNQSLLIAPCINHKRHTFYSLPTCSII